MFTFKNNYYFIIENTRDIDLSNIKKTNKFNIIYRIKNKDESIKKLFHFRKHCKRRNINFYKQ